MNHLLDNPTLVIALGAALLAVAAYFVMRSMNAGRERTKGILSRAERARMTYDDYAKEYRKAFDALEKQGYCVLDVIHDLSDEWKAKDDAHQFIAYEETPYLCEKIRRSPKSPLLVILHTLGGYSLPSEMVANAIKKHPGKKEAYVPYVAMSGGTVIALATDKIHMGKDAFLGPIDTQYHGFPAVAFDELKKAKHPDAISDDVLLTSYMVDQHNQTAMRRAMSVLNAQHQVRGDEEYVVRELMAKGRHHGEPISAEEAKRIKISVDTAVQKDVYSLVDARLGMMRMSNKKPPPDGFASVSMVSGGPKPSASSFRRFNAFRGLDAPAETA